jgi:hypothetical protein
MWSAEVIGHLGGGDAPLEVRSLGMHVISQATDVF